MEEVVGSIPTRSTKSSLRSSITSASLPSNSGLFRPSAIISRSHHGSRSGTKLGPYEIQAHVGEGGMGEVYRARDTRLNRSVAIKILPASMADDPAACIASSRKRVRSLPSTIPNILVGLRRRGTGRHALPGDGAARGRNPSRAAQSWAARRPQVCRDRPSDRAWPGSCARARHRASRSEA